MTRILEYKYNFQVLKEQHSPVLFPKMPYIKAGIEEIFVKGVYDHFPVDTDDVVYDVGGWLGDSMMYYASAGASVFSFEPYFASYERLRQVQQANKPYSDKVWIYPFGLGEKHAIIMGYINNMMFNAGDGKSEISVVPLDSLDMTPPTLIKIDTEGYELPILKGAKETLKNHPRLIIESHSHSDFEQITNFLKQYDYQISFQSDKRTVRGKEIVNTFYE